MLMNYNANGIYGDRTGCIFEAWQVVFFIAITGYSLCLIAYMVRLRVTAPSKHKKNRNGFIFKAQVVFWICGALFATFSTVWPGSARLNSSGTYCLAAFELPWSAIFFCGAALFPTVLFVAVQYLWIFIYVYKAKKSLEQESNEEKHDSRSYLILARQLGVLVMVYFVCYLPFFVSAIYEWITEYYAPPYADFAGVLVHVASVANPVMYLWTSNQAKAELSRLWNEWVQGIITPRTPTTETESANA